MTIKAIETPYKGHLFRSRIEARWAVFFDSLGLPWEYEKEGFDLGPGGLYLPDFWLPSLDAWCEVKGEEPADTTKQELLSGATGKSVYLATGGIPYPDPGDYSWGENLTVFSDGHYYDSQHWWCECVRCCNIGIEYNGHSERLACHSNEPGRRYGEDTPRLRDAYFEARSARFEHGERP